MLGMQWRLRKAKRKSKKKHFYYVSCCTSRTPTEWKIKLKKIFVALFELCSRDLCSVPRSPAHSTHTIFNLLPGNSERSRLVTNEIIIKHTAVPSSHYSVRKVKCEHARARAPATSPRRLINSNAKCSCEENISANFFRFDAIRVDYFSGARARDSLGMHSSATSRFD